ncbi:hypothetical protein B0T21DRAFT_381052 [Apiosordaria backusii]|uniref:Uncharacterized protein n=1 Tax=Apiosordaria backusii TaxID=314023 RepID=A0AA40K3V6_9PEZI|nr:hypothetical protein B0T21DRAFT_381052 [Apiosordaria backusii]
MGSVYSKQKHNAQEPPPKKPRARLRKSLRGHSHHQSLNEPQHHQDNESPQTDKTSDNIYRRQDDVDEAQEMPVVRRSQGDVDPELSTEECEKAARDFFPDICPDYLRKTAESRTWTAQGIIEHILDQQEKGVKYPKRSKSLKRKRADTHEDDEEELRKKFEAEPRHQGKPPEYFKKYKAAA